MTTTPDDIHTLDGRRPPKQGLRPLLLRIHFYAGVFVGPFILIAAITGLLYAMIPQLDSMVYRHELTVEQVGQHRLPLSDQLNAVRAAHPEGTVESIRPPAAPEETTQVALAVADVPPDYGRTVFVDPYTGEVRGALTTYGQWLPVRAWFDELHRNLHLGAIGRNYSELAASWLWIVSLAGVALWFLHRKRTGPLRARTAADRATTDRRRTAYWHGTVGVWITLALLGLSITGVTWSRYGGQSVNLLQERLAMTAPDVDTTLGGAAPEPMVEGHHHGVASTPGDAALSGADTVLHAADEAGLRGPRWMYPPAEPGHGWRVAERKRDWPTRYDAISVDPASGTVTDRVNFADWPFLAKLTNWAIDAHMGVLFGIVNQIVLAVTAIGLTTIVWRGYRMWWQRRPAMASAWAMGGPPPRGVLRNLSPPVLTGLIVATVAVGYFLPLFGLSLATFLLVDVIVGAVIRTKTRTPSERTSN